MSDINAELKKWLSGWADKSAYELLDFIDKNYTLSAKSENKYPIGGYAPGDYMRNCGSCGSQFLGGKRAFQCEPCGTKSQADWEALTPEQQLERQKRNVELYNEFMKNNSSTEQLSGADQVCGKTELKNLATISDSVNSKEIKYGQLWARHSELVDKDSVGKYRITFEGLKKAVDEALSMQPKPAGAVWVKANASNIKDGDYIAKFKPPGINLQHDYVGMAFVKEGYIRFACPPHYNITWRRGHEELQYIKILDESGTASRKDISEDAHEKEVMMQAFAKVVELFEKREWIMHGRGSYPYNDDRYKEEVRYLYDEFEAIRKDTWINIKSKTFEYRQKIIEQYLKDNPSNNDAFDFAEWIKAEGWNQRSSIDWAKYETIYSDVSIKTTADLHQLYQQSKSKP